jgi:hypothetical protein
LSAACVTGLALERVACVFREDKRRSQNRFVKLDVHWNGFLSTYRERPSFSCAAPVVSIEGIDPEFRYGETSCIAPGRRTDKDEHSGRAKSAFFQVSVCLFAQIFGKLGP